WHFEKDDKKEKRTAREMIAMTTKINKELFSGRTEVSCFTCHRGSTRPASIVPLPQERPPFPTPKPERPLVPPLEEVIKKYTASLGNAARLSKPRILKGTRTSSDGSSVPIEVEESGARWHISAELPTGHLEQVVNEKAGWSKDAKGVVEFTESQSENFGAIAVMLTLPPPSSIPADAQVLSTEVLAINVLAVVVGYRTPDQVRHRLSFNATTGQLMRHVALRDTPIGAVPAEADFEQWQDSGGAMFPFQVRISLVDPWVGSTRVYSRVTLDATIPETAFAKPK